VRPAVVRTESGIDIARRLFILNLDLKAPAIGKRIDANASNSHKYMDHSCPIKLFRIKLKIR
jgi:hypothetical protein